MSIDVISLGAGVQSSTMALMAACGELTPMPTAAIFADTQNEPKAVYEWLDYLEGQLPFPVYRVTRGNLAEASLRVRVSKNGLSYTKHAVPAFMLAPDGKVGVAMRQCTGSFKIEVLHREYRRMIGRTKAAKLTQWIGFSVDEAARAKHSQLGWITNRWPLLEKMMSRRDCLAWLKANGFPKPPRSACVMCPYRSAPEWQEMKQSDPEAFDTAVKFEQDYQVAFKSIPTIYGVPYLHRSCVPLSEIDFTKPQSRQKEFEFSTHCEGICGV